LGVALATCARKDRLPREEQRYLCMEAMLKSGVDSAVEQLLLTSIETYLKLNEEEKMKYAERMSTSPYRAELREKELTWAGELHEKGRRRGRQEGRQEGLRVAQRLLMNIVTRRFGEPPADLAKTIQRLEDPVRLEALSDRALTAADLEEFEASLEG